MLHDFEKDFTQFLDELDFVNNRMSSYSFFVVVITSAHLLTSIAFGFLGALSGGRGLNSDVALFLFMVDFSLLICTIFLLVRFEHQRRRGDVLFQEISDSVEWKMASEETEFSPEGVVRRRHRPLSVRVVLKQFVVNSSLPFFHGIVHWGVVSYLTGNILLTVWTVGTISRLASLRF